MAKMGREESQVAVQRPRANGSAETDLRPSCGEAIVSYRDRVPGRPGCSSAFPDRPWPSSEKVN